jgi:pimeloyl-ACP methyl ester carboxylesterase
VGKAGSSLRIVGRWLLYVFAACVLCMLLGALAIVAMDAEIRARNARELAIRTPDGIDWGGFVPIGGVPQWVRIRGLHLANPALLLLHGGPGDAQSELTKLYEPLEAKFTIIQWDQRGAGRTFGRGIRLDPNLPYQRLVADGLEVTRYALRRLDQPKLILVGHSLGSALGVHMVKEHPELFSAFVGTGFLVSQSARESETYRRLLRLARDRNDNATLSMLERVGPPPYRRNGDFLALDEIVRDRYGDPGDRAFWGFNRTSEPAYVFTSPELTIGQMIDWYRAIMTAIFEAPYPPDTHMDIRPLGYDFRIPVFIIQGDNDWETPTDLAARYFEKIRAPYKEYLSLPGGHWAAMLHMRQFTALLVARVRPLALEASGTRLSGSSPTTSSMAASAPRIPLRRLGITENRRSCRRQARLTHALAVSPVDMLRESLEVRKDRGVVDAAGVEDQLDPLAGLLAADDPLPHPSARAKILPRSRVHREDAPLRSDPRRDARRTIYADLIQCEWIDARVDGRQPFDAIDDALTAARVFHSEEGGDEQTLRPIEKPRLHPVVLRDREPFKVPIERGRQ